MQAVQLASSEDALLEPYTPTDDERTQVPCLDVQTHTHTNKHMPARTCMQAHTMCVLHIHGRAVYAVHTC